MPSSKLTQVFASNGTIVRWESMQQLHIESAPTNFSRFRLLGDCRLKVEHAGNYTDRLEVGSDCSVWLVNQEASSQARNFECLQIHLRWGQGERRTRALHL